MAAFRFSSSFLFVSVSVSVSLACLLCTFSSAKTDVKATVALINDICFKTHNPTVCLQALKSDPRTPAADVPGLGQISIDLTQASAKNTYSILGSLRRQTNDPKVKEIYATCLENYDDAISNLDQARKFLSSGDYNSLNTYASAVSTDADTCDGSFQRPAVEPPQLKQANQKLEDLSSIILVISNRLAGII